MPYSADLDIKLSPLILKRHEWIFRNRDDILKQNEVLQGRWRILERIHAGVNGDIYRAYDPDSKKDVAIKVGKISPSSLEREAHILRRLKNHQHFCRHIYHEIAPKMNFLVMELQGRNLTDLTKDIGFFSLGTTLHIGLQMLSAIEILHRVGYVHCNIKLSNFAVGRNNCREICLLDFAIAENFLLKMKGHVSMRTSQSFKGSYEYASPNVHKGLELSRRDDLWSLLYTLIGCRVILPWAGDNRHEHILKKKEQRIEYLINLHLSSDFIIFKEYLLSLRHVDDPDYDLIRSCFNKALNRFNILDTEIYDWENNPKKVWKVLRSQSTQKSCYSYHCLGSEKEDDHYLPKSADQILNRKNEHHREDVSQRIRVKAVGKPQNTKKPSIVNESKARGNLAKKTTPASQKNFVVAYHTLDKTYATPQILEANNQSGPQFEPSFRFMRLLQTESEAHPTANFHHPSHPYSESGHIRNRHSYAFEASTSSCHTMPLLRLVEIKPDSEKRTLETQAVKSEELLGTLIYEDDDEYEYGNNQDEEEEDDDDGDDDDDDDDVDDDDEEEEEEKKDYGNENKISDMSMKAHKNQSSVCENQSKSVEEKHIKKHKKVKKRSKSKKKSLSDKVKYKSKHKSGKDGSQSSCEISKKGKADKEVNKQNSKVSVTKTRDVKICSQPSKIIKKASNSSLKSSSSKTSNSATTKKQSTRKKHKVKKKRKEKTKSKSDSNVKYLATSLKRLQLPDNESPLVPPMPQKRSVYRPNHIQLLDPIPETKLLEVETTQQKFYRHYLYHRQHAHIPEYFLINSVPYHKVDGVYYMMPQMDKEPMNQ